MTDNEKLIKILRVPIFSHELADPTEAVADYLLDNDVVPVVRCKDCKHWKKGDFRAGNDLDHLEYGGDCPIARFARYESDFCSRGERKEQ